MRNDILPILASSSPPSSGASAKTFRAPRLPNLALQLGRIAYEEVLEGWRGRWIPVLTAVWAVLVFVVSRGAVQVGTDDVPAFLMASSALFDLAILVIPLLALVLGVVSLSLDAEGLEFLWLQPVGRATGLMGRVLGQVVALCAALTLGMLPTFMWLGRTGGRDRVEVFLCLIALCSGLAIAFHGLATVLAVWLRSRMKAVGAGLGVWVALVVLYDAALMGLVAWSGNAFFRADLLAFILANPADTARVAFLMVSGAHAFAGPAGAMLARGVSGPGAWCLVAGMLAWMIGPYAAAAALWRHKDL